MIVRQAIVVGVACQGRGIRRRHGLQRSSIAGAVTQKRQMKVLRGEIARPLQGGQLLFGGSGLIVEGVQVGIQPALRDRQIELRLLGLQLRLSNAAPRGAPVPDGNVERDLP